MTRPCGRGHGRRTRRGGARPSPAARVYPPLTLDDVERLRAGLLQQLACDAGHHARWVDICGAQETCRTQMCAACCVPRAAPRWPVCVPAQRDASPGASGQGGARSPDARV